MRVRVEPLFKIPRQDFVDVLLLAAGAEFHQHITHLIDVAFSFPCCQLPPLEFLHGVRVGHRGGGLLLVHVLAPFLVFRPHPGQTQFLGLDFLQDGDRRLPFQIGAPGPVFPAPFQLFLVAVNFRIRVSLGLHGQPYFFTNGIRSEINFPAVIPVFRYAPLFRCHSVSVSVSSGVLSTPKQPPTTTHNSTLGPRAY